MLSKGKLFIVSAPSGAGKTTLCNMMLNKYPEIQYSVSYTTRQPRVNEIDGKDYFFVSKDIFLNMINNGEFIEWAEVHGNYYGTSIKFINNMLNKGINIILDIDPQGAMQLKDKLNNAIYIFITAPSFKDFELRLKERGTDSIEDIERRLNNAKNELNYFDKYDYLIVNNDKDTAFKSFEAIFIAEKNRSSNYKKINDFINI